jgi:aspartate aminotransferase
VRPENVIASCGAKQSIMVLLHAILDPKDEVIFPVPYWVSYPEMVKLAGGVPVP